jgi:hypothetical protein
LFTVSIAWAWRKRTSSERRRGACDGGGCACTRVHLAAAQPVCVRNNDLCEFGTVSGRMIEGVASELITIG